MTTPGSHGADGELNPLCFCFHGIRAVVTGSFILALSRGKFVFERGGTDQSNLHPKTEFHRITKSNPRPMQLQGGKRILVVAKEWKASIKSDDGFNYKVANSSWSLPRNGKPASRLMITHIKFSESTDLCRRLLISRLPLDLNAKKNFSFHHQLTLWRERE